MADYRIGFYKDVLGVGFPVINGRIEIRRARSLDRAVNAAKLRFARRQGITDWHLRADHFEVEPSEGRPERES